MLTRKMAGLLTGLEFILLISGAVTCFALGGPDITFGPFGRGVQSVNLYDEQIDTYDLPWDMVMHGDTAWVAGYTWPDGQSSTIRPFVAGISGGGNLKREFGVGGFAVLNDLTTQARFHALAVQSDGKIVAAGYIYENVSGVTYRDVFAARFNTNGSLDSTFGSGGLYRHSLPENSESFTCVKIAPDGSLFLGGMYWNGRDSDFMVAKLSSSGIPDTSFDGDGFRYLDWGAGEEVSDLQLQADGSILICGSYVQDRTSWSMACVRLDSAGIIDTGFGDNGLFLYSSTQTDRLGRMHIYADGRILLFGVNYKEGVLLRLSTEGVLDEGFSDDGVLQIAQNGADVGGLAVGEDGSIYCSLKGYGAKQELAVFKVSAAGVPDSETWGGGTDLNQNLSPRALGMTTSGQVMVVGYKTYPDTTASSDERIKNSTPTRDTDMVLCRLASDGLPDPVWGMKGMAIFDQVRKGGSFVKDAAVSADDKIVAVGYSNRRFHADDENNVPDTSAFAARFTANGLLDTSFNTDGYINFDFGMQKRAVLNSVQVLPDGKIIAAGSLTDNDHSGLYDSIMARFNQDGTLDTSFGDNGIARGGAERQALHDIALNPAGQIVGGGSSDFQPALFRFASNGSTDPDFGENGVHSIANDAQADLSNNFVHRICIDYMGFILAGIPRPSGDAFVIYRSLADGFPDRSLGGDGLHHFTYFEGNSVSDLSTLDDGSFIVYGNALINGDNQFVAIKRLHRGIFDTSFGSNGVVTYGSIRAEKLYSGLVDDNGKIVMAGLAHSDAAVVRLDSNGDLDLLFGDTGVATAVVDGNDYASAVVEQSDGKFVIAGYGTDPGHNYGNIILARFDGSLSVNNPPVAVDTSYTATEGRQILMTPQANDSDPDGDDLIITEVGDASHGEVELINSFQVGYTSGFGYLGADSFSYTISDGRGGEASATVYIDVAADGTIAYIPHITGGEDDWTDFLTVTNAGDAEGSFSMVLFDASGAVVNELVSYPVNSKEQVRYSPKTIAPTAVCGRVSYKGEGLIFRVSYSNRNGGVAEFILPETAVNFPELLFPQGVDMVSWRGLAIMNTGLNQSGVELTAYGDGAALGTADLTVPGMSRVSGVLGMGSLFPELSAADIDYVLVTESSSELTAITIAGDESSRRLLFTPARRSGDAPLSVAVPHLTADSAGWKDLMIVDNMGGDESSYSMTMFDDEGITVYGPTSQAVAARQTLTVNMGELAPTAVCAKISVLNESLRFREAYERVGSGGVAQFDLTVSPALRAYCLFDDYAFMTWKGFALMNRGDADKTVTLNAYAGGVMTGESSVLIPANSRIARLAGSVFPELESDQIEYVEAVTDSAVLNGIAIGGNADSSAMVFTPAVPR